MNVLDRTSGQTFQFPDDATDDDIITAMESGRQQQSFNPLAQQFMGGLGNIAQQLIQPEPASTLPNIGGGAMVGLTPQQAQWTLGQAQQANVTSMEERMRKQQAIQQGIEAEKDRAQELKFKQAELKNRLNEMKFQKELAEFEATNRAKEGELNRAQDREIAQQDFDLRKGAQEIQRQEAADLASYRQAGLGIDQQRLEIDRQQAEQMAAERERSGFQRVTLARTMPDGTKEPWEAWTKPGTEPEYIGPAPESIKDEEIINDPNDYRILEDRDMLIKSIVQQNRDADYIQPISHVAAEALATARMGRGQQPFIDENEMRTWIEAQKGRIKKAIKTESVMSEKEMDPAEAERIAEDDATIMAYEMMGLVEGQDFEIDPDEGTIHLVPDSPKVKALPK